MQNWTNYSKDELEAHYDNRAKVADFLAIVKGWNDKSIAARANLGFCANLSYGPDPRQLIDLFLPEKLPAPLHVFFHGGYWQAMNKDAFSFMAAPLVKKGIAVAVVNYRLCPAVTMDAVKADAQAAISWLFNNGSKFQVIAKKMQLSGHSAGGHLVAMLAATPPAKIDPLLPEDWLHSALTISGLFDLMPLIHTKVNDLLNMNEKEAKALSPCLLTPKLAAPLLLAVGALEGAEYHRQGQTLKEAWKNQLNPPEIIILKDKNHFNILEELASTDGLLLKHALALWNN
jgi:arylformamidase